LVWDLRSGKSEAKGTDRKKKMKEAVKPKGTRSTSKATESKS